MTNRNTPNIAVIDHHRLEALGLREIILQVRSRARVTLFKSGEDFLGEQSDVFDIVFSDTETLVLYDYAFRNKPFMIIPLVRNDHNELSGGTFAGDDAVGPRLNTLLGEDDIRRNVTELLDRTKTQKSGQPEGILSGRETEVLRAVASGLTNKEIAEKLNISMNTVMTHRKNITAKLNIKTVSGLTFYALMNHLVSGEEVVKKATE